MSDILTAIYVLIGLSVWARYYELGNKNVPNPLATTFFIALLWPVIWFHYLVKKVDDFIVGS